jgi:hypothetical protein
VAVAQLFLVRLMIRAALVVLLALPAFLLSSCISFPRVTDASGHDAKLPWSELAEIHRLVADRQDIRKPITEIWLDQPGYAEVMSGTTEKTGDPVSVFHIRKKHGKWFIEEHVVKDTTVIVTS